MPFDRNIARSAPLFRGEPTPLPTEVARRLRHLPGFVFLDSASADPGTATEAARYSILAARPRALHRGNLFDSGGATALSRAIARRAEPPAADLGFPTTGLYGSIDYEGDYCFGEYDGCLVYDHREDRWHGYGPLARDPALAPPSRESGSPYERVFGERKGREGRGGIRALPAFGAPALRRAWFLEAVARAQDYIAAGDIYQVNLSHCFELESPVRGPLFAYYEALREASPAPYSAYLDLGGREILSSSPELFLRLSCRSAATRPIKGTRPRFRDSEQDEKSAYDLITSAKEIAELVMITDLERNDLGQICEYGTVRVTELLKLERYSQVFHLVSTVEGLLRPEVGPLDALAACFPGGSITGAPKRRAREIIAELEPVPRGLYTGVIGCFGDNGESRFSIAIRTAVREGGRLHFHVGAGIVADSVPEREWEETLHKAAGLLQAWERHAESPADS